MECHMNGECCNYCDVVPILSCLPHMVCCNTIYLSVVHTSEFMYVSRCMCEPKRSNSMSKMNRLLMEPGYVHG